MNVLSNRIIPILLLDKDGLVKTRNFQHPTYIGDPINAVRIFNDKYVDELVLLDIGRTRDGLSPDFDLISLIAEECFMPLGYGGGILNFSQAKRIFASGVEKVILQTALFENPDLVQEIANFGGSQSVAASIDVVTQPNGEFRIFNSGKSKIMKANIYEFLQEIERRGIGEIILTSVNFEGSMEGYNLELIKKIRPYVNVPIVANGGAGRVEDFGAAVRCGANALGAGSMFLFHGEQRGVLINYPQNSEI